MTAIGLRPSSAAVLRRVGMCLPISDAVAEGARLARRGVPFEVMPDFIPDPDADPDADAPAGDERSDPGEGA